MSRAFSHFFDRHRLIDRQTTDSTVIWDVSENPKYTLPSSIVSKSVIFDVNLTLASSTSTGGLWCTIWAGTTRPFPTPPAERFLLSVVQGGFRSFSGWDIMSVAHRSYGH